MRYLLASPLLFLIATLTAHPVFATPRPDCGTVVGVGKSIQAAINSPPSNKIICIKPGIYHEAININVPGLTVTAYDPEKKPVIDGQFTLPSGNPQNPGWYDFNKNNQQDAGEEWKANCSENQAVATQGLPNIACTVYAPLVDISANQITLSNIHITQSRGTGVRIYNKNQTISNTLIDQVDIGWSRNYGISVPPNDLPHDTSQPNTWKPAVKNFTIQYSTIHDNQSDAQYARSAGTKSGYNHGAAISIIQAQDIVLKNNTVFQNWGEAFAIDGHDSGTHNVIAQDNVFYDNYRSIYFHGVSDFLFQRNLLYLTTNTINPQLNMNYINIVPSEPQFNYIAPSKNITIANNICVLGLNRKTAGCLKIQSGARSNKVEDIFVYNNTFYAKDSDTSIFRITNDILNINLTNNIAFHEASSSLVETLPTTGTQLSSSHNCYSAPKSSLDPKYQGAGDIYNCQPNFQGIDNKGTIPEIRRGEVKPEWFKLKNNSPVINKGVNLAGKSITWLSQEKYLTQDFWKAKRPQASAFDLGAHEYNDSPIPTNTPPPTTTPSSSPNTTLTPTLISFDYNNDNQVNYLDLSLFVDNKLSQTLLFDGNKNGIVDIFDFSGLLSRLTF
jgi:hypothetical protein